MFLEDWFHNDELRPLLILAGFLCLIIAVLILVEWDRRRHIKLEKAKYIQELVQQRWVSTSEVLPDYAEEDAAATRRLWLLHLNAGTDDQMFSDIEEYRSDFDEPSKASGEVRRGQLSTDSDSRWRNRDHYDSCTCSSCRL